MPVDRSAIAELFATYAAAMDDHEMSLLKGVFTADASFALDIEGVDRGVGPLQPRDSILEFISSTVSGQADQRRHVITNIRVVEEAEDRANVNALLTLLVTDNGELSARSTGVYKTTVARTANSWLFDRMHLKLDRAF